MPSQNPRTPGFQLAPQVWGLRDVLRHPRLHHRSGWLLTVGKGCADSPALLQSPGAHKLSLCSACLSALSPEMMVHLRIISSSGELPPSSLKLSIFKMPAASRIKKPRLMYRCLQCIIQSPFFASLL